METVYRCGWCGTPTDENGNWLTGEQRERAIDLIESNNCNTHLTDCGCKEQRQYVQVTRDMAIDAGDVSLEGTWVEW